MKKILYLLILLSLPLISFGQTQKSGTLTSETWNYDVWITSNATIGNGVTITISPGYTVYLNPGVSLNIVGSGTLLAQGSLGSKITFTAYGTNPSWGHLYFNNTSASGNSKLEYCIIEKGNATGLGVPYGGALLVQSSKLDISNCIIRNNQANWGGGVFLYSGYTLNISNTLIDGNTVATGGGGIYFWNGTTSTITNCIITNNVAGGDAAYYYGGGGVMIGHQVSNIRIINSVIANNTCSVIGDNVLFFQNSSSNTSIKNSIIWGTNNSVSYHNQSPSSSDLINCAIEGTIAPNYTSCIDLNATNDNANGPNFTTEGTDWSIKFISPCRDAGTSSGAPSTDYLGNGRVGPYDIGAYEVQ